MAAHIYSGTCRCDGCLSHEATRYFCMACNQPGVRPGVETCELCGEAQEEPFRVGWDESD